MSRIFSGKIKNHAISSSGIYSGSYPAAQAFDGNSSSYSNRWVSQNNSFTSNEANQPVWWQIKFDRPLTITKMNFAISTTHIKRVQVVVSNSGAFTGEEVLVGDITINESNNSTSTSLTEIYPLINPTEGRYLRINVLETDGPSTWASINEIYMYTDDISIVRMLITEDNGGESYVTVAEWEMFDHPDSNLDLCLRGGAEASSEANGSNIAEYAFDDDLVDKWTNNGSPAVSDLSPAWIQYEFQTPINLKAYDLIACISGQESYAPADWQIQVSSDGENFTTIQTIVSEGGWVGEEERSYTISNGVIQGVTQINGIPSECTVRLYNRSTGQLHSEVTSNDSTGEYEFTNLLTQEYDLVCIGSNEVCPQISGPLTPVDSGSAGEYEGVEVLKMNFNESDGFSSHFTDEGRYNLDVAIGAGSPTHSDEQSLNGKYSLKLDGSSDYLAIVNQPTLFSVIGDITIEAWVYRNATGVRDVIMSKYVAFNTDGFTFQIMADDTLRFSVGSGTYQSVYSVNTIPAGEWVHVAAVKSGQDISVFINGALEATETTTGTPEDNTAPLWIGRDSIATDRHFGGYFDSLIVTQDVAKYDSSFVPETPTVSNAYYDAVIASSPTAYWRLDDTGSTVVDDLGTHDGTYINSPTQNKAPMINAGSGRSVKFNGTSQYATVPDHTDLRPGTGEYAIEMWMGFSGTSYGMAFGKFDLSVPYTGPTIFANYNDGTPTAGPVYFRDNNNSSYGLATSANWLNDGVWRHYVCQRRLVSESPDVYELQIYINGVLDNSIELPSVIDLNTTNLIYLCSRPDASQYVNGQFDEIAYYVGKSLTPAEILAHYQAAQD